MKNLYRGAINFLRGQKILLNRINRIFFSVGLSYFPFYWGLDRECLCSSVFIHIFLFFG